MKFLTFLLSCKFSINSKKSGNKKSGADFATEANRIINEATETRAKKTVDNYRTALNSFIRHMGNNITVGDIDKQCIKRYERKLVTSNICRNTISAYMRALRSLLNKIDPDTNYEQVFKGVFTGNEKTHKRSITLEDIHKLQNAQTDNSLRFVRDIFLFSIYASGMPFVDLAHLRWSNVRDGHIIYERQKTGQRISVKINQPMQEVINRYARKGACYLFPILNSTDPREAAIEYEKALKTYNKKLNRLADIADTPHLSSYVVRHTWATIAYSECVELPVISRSLGHNNTKTTLIYIREINDNRTDEASDIVTQAIGKGMNVPISNADEKIPKHYSAIDECFSS